MPENETPYLSVVFPAYNEADKIEKNLSSVISFFERKNFPYEVVVVEDGSKDNTLKILQEMTVKFPQLRLLRNKQNMGKGASVKKGILSARGKFILFSDVDLSTPIDEFNKFLPYLKKGFDVVIGSRRFSDSQVKRQQKFARRFFGNCFYFLVHHFLLPDIADTNCGFKAYRRETAQQIFAKQKLARWGFDAELLFIARKKGFKIKQVPVSWYNADTSTIKVRRVILGTLRELVKIRWNSWKGVYD
ncbi:MAG: glycosyltransferase family 2 protein [Candidatus Cloacimonetes bacterium]|nr:glycosyltransferase family 2 protein [Candidatus Cloacimonadota bacterium]